MALGCGWTAGLRLADRVVDEALDVEAHLMKRVRVQIDHVAGRIVAVLQVPLLRRLQHARIEELFLLVTGADADLRRDAFDQLVRLLAVHETAEEEVSIVQSRVAELGRALELPAEAPALGELRRLVTIFRELRGGVTEDGKTKLKSPSGTPPATARPTASRWAA